MPTVSKSPDAPREANVYGCGMPVSTSFVYFPFGARNSGPLFCEIIESIVHCVEGEFHRHGVTAQIVNYSADVLLVADTQAMCHAALCVAYDTFTSIGVKINPSKPVHPTQVSDVVGVLFNPVTGQMGVTEARRETLICELKALL